MNIRFIQDLLPALKPVAAAGAPDLNFASKQPVTNFLSQPMLMTAGNSGNRKVRAQRRRRGTSEPGERERADAPSRERDKQPSRPPSGGGGGGGGGGSSSGGGFARPTGGLPLGGGGKRPPMILIGIVLVLVVCGMFFFGGGDDANQPVSEPVNQVNTVPTATSAPVAPVAQNTPTSAAQAAAPAQSSQSSANTSDTSEGQTWLIMMYQDADDKVLERDIYIDLNEAEKIGSSDRVHIVSQMDRYQGGFRGDGDWTDTRRLYVTQDQDLERVGSQVVQEIGEANMSSGQTLVDFMVWAINTYPADKHVLIMSDHGMGWPGGWTDPSHPGRGEHDIPLAQVLGDELYLMEIDDALGQVRAETGIDKFEMIGMDACLMGHLEVFSALAPHANYAVASQETEPALGWAYTSFLAGLQQNPDMSGADLSRLIVDSYIREDQRIVDDAERAKFVGQGSPLGGLFGMLGGPSPQQIEAQLSQNMTLSAVDLSQIPALNASFNDLAFNLQRVDQRAVAQARNYSQSFTSVFGSNVPPSYIDIGHFAQVIRQASRDQALNQSLDQVLAALGQAVIAEKHGPKKPGATGISIYFPNSQLYQSPAAGPPSYTVAARRFVTESLWDDFLTFHYTGRQFQPADNTVSLPSRNDPLVIPGLGEITVSPIALSSNTVAPGETVLISAEVEGDNIGYIKLFVGFYDQTANAINIADTDYLESSSTIEVNGIYYPDWGTGSFTLEFEWEPIVFGINDGTDTVVAHFKPETYGATFEEATYTVDGIYTYGDGGEQRYARLYFNNGLLKQVFGFTGENGTGSPREIIPSTGDQFTVFENWLDLDPQGNVVERTQEMGQTLTFGDNTFVWQDLDAAAGNYLVGFVVEDLDGNEKEVFQVVTVQ